MQSMGTQSAQGVVLMDDFGVCTRCEDTQFVDDLITLGDWLLCDDCYEEL